MVLQQLRVPLWSGSIVIELLRGHKYTGCHILLIKLNN